jgi:hypothetical protein
VQYSNAKVAQHVASFSSQLLQSNVVVPIMPQKQAQKPLGYPTALSKGRALLTLIRSTSTFISAAPFTLASIATWGYESRRYGAEAILDDYTSLLHVLGSDTYMRPLPYDGTGGDNMDITFRQTTSVSVGNTTYPASNAYFCSVLNPQAGLFIAINNMNPAAKVLLDNQVVNSKHRCPNCGTGPSSRSSNGHPSFPPQQLLLYATFSELTSKTRIRSPS